ncbi:MAG: S41 family peptidase [Bacteroidales bacterium]|jgi:carboxyl-terminal processing protease|nr:S41 family peptidase [Bacteroidales bacterium]MDD2263930.1 S41 family peptidase [Bacteroidales bacterium]MDD2831164.1 S41 family peptidase [Bacteroidales bacterium]MDD3209275.1 S41 family peptidase [Bacteroidales bacterium]MDD3697598.1 S41 family peptidase [Bacteroidales bacterium]
MEEHKKTRRTGAIVLIVLIALAIAGILRWNAFRNKNGTGRNKLSNEWSKLELILNQIQNNYVDSVDVSSFIEKTLPFIMEELDPHSIYLSPDELRSADEELRGNIEGIGIVFNVPSDTATVINVVVGGPSEKMGLQAGDKIIKVDTQTIAGVQMPQDSIMRLLKGPKGTLVDVWVKRYGEDDLICFSIIRDRIPVNSVDVAYMADSITGYIKLSRFSMTSYAEVLGAIADLMKQGMKQVIFDLRDNTGGYLDQALKITGEFLDENMLIVYTEGSHRERQDFYTKKRGFCYDMPLAVLINEASASSSEIMAGALQDNDRGTIIGRRSYGKGLVQEPVYFSDNSGLRLTVARFYTPLGRSIQKPYRNNSREYAYDLLERYRHGELMQEDSIPKNDSLKYMTPAGKVLYGGGGIIPDVFVPLDTTGVNELYLRITRQNLPIRFSMNFADRNRKDLSAISGFKDLEYFFARRPLEKEFLSFIRDQGIRPVQNQWKECGSILMTQIKAYIGRNTRLEDKGFYPYLGRIDNVLLKALEVLCTSSVTELTESGFVFAPVGKNLDE